MATSIFSGNNILFTTDIPKIITQFISDKDAVFVFPSSIARDTWCEWTIKNHELTGVKCTPQEKWMAWDEFKAACCSKEIENLSCIPSPLRKLFARHILSKKMNEPEPYFEVIVNRGDCKSLLHFNSWLSKLLPNLKQWTLKKFGSVDIEKNYENLMKGLTDGEDRDFLKLYRDYTVFLRENHLYEPDYLEPDFSKADKTFIIFYPETLKDYFDYKELFEKENVYSVCVPEIEDHNKHPECVLYPDARTELRKTILKIRKLHDNGTPWDDIALTVPDLKTSCSYIERELKLYEIPYLLRSGYDKTINCPGQMFVEIEQCVKNNFAFPYLRALMEDSFIPWKYGETYKTIIEIANETRSLYPYKKQGEDADENITEDPVESALQLFDKDWILETYRTFRKYITDFYRSKSFSEMRDMWTRISNDLIWADRKTKIWEKDENNIIGLCINNLDELKNIETRYLKSHKQLLHIDSCYDFFLDRLRDDPYVPINEKFRSISLFDYKMSGPAWFKYQFIINANQKDLSVNTRELDFLKEEKRRLLSCQDNNFVTAAFINLYNKESTVAEFSCSSNGFSGFSISHTYFTEKKWTSFPELKSLDQEDFYINERNWLLNDSPSPSKITIHQKNAMENWISRIQDMESPLDKQKKIAEKAKETLRFTINEDNLDPEGKYYKISQTDLKNFFPCPRSWLFSKLFKIKEEQIAQDIFDHFDAGNIFHETISNWLSDYYLKKNLPVFGSPSWDEQTIRDQIMHSIEKTITLEKDKKVKISDYKKSPLRIKIIESQKDKFCNNIYDFISKLCTENDKSPKNHLGNYRVISTETSYMDEDEGGYRLFGKIDALLSHPEEGIGETIVDFKTGTPPKTSEVKIAEKSILVDGKKLKGKVLKDFQMATYTTLLDHLSKNLKVSEGIFLSTKHDSNNPEEYNSSYVFSKVYNNKCTKRDDSEKGFNITLSEFSEYVKLFKELLDNKDLSPDFTGKDIRTYVNKNETCSNCRFNSICRTTYTMAKSEENAGGKK
ncbi:MAG: PD-(D/E)XK nuclease family protein [Treponema sp.]|nr:PD-(D/E)XK nuclease family protein [Treponema sp.]